MVAAVTKTVIKQALAGADSVPVGDGAPKDSPGICNTAGNSTLDSLIERTGSCKPWEQKNVSHY